MPTKSSFPDVPVPDVDIWTFMFDREDRHFSDDQVIYRSATNPSRKYTYAQVKTAAETFGMGLVDIWDWKRGDVLSIYAPNDIDVGPIIFGVLFARGIVSPANPAYSADELAFQLKNSGSKAIVTTPAFLPAALKAAHAAGIAPDRILLLGEDRNEAHQVPHWTKVLPTPMRFKRRKIRHPSRELAFLVYSSGTTGLPKGVMLSHSNIISNLTQIYHAIGKTSYQTGEDKILGVLPFFHIYGLTGLVHQPLHRGVELVVMPAFDLKLFLETIQKQRITFIYVAPPVILRLARDDMVQNYDLSSLKMMTSGAAPLTRELVDTVHKKFQIKINQAYGLSETSPMTHTQPWDEWYSSVGSVGKIFPNMLARYVSAEGIDLGPGETGELWMAGPNVFQGYWKNDAATADAIEVVDGVRWFKTGDVGFQDEKHNFYITDRVKELIKHKGFQVAPAELEGKLMDHPLVNDIAVIGVDDRENHTEVPRAYIVHANLGATAGDPQTGVPTTATQPDAQDIIDWTAQRVANHKRLRGGVRFIDEIPKSASGKILRRVLKERVKQEMSTDGKAKAKL